MKTNNLPDSWCVESDCSQEYINTVIKYLCDNYNVDYGGYNYSYYGINTMGVPSYSDRALIFDTLLTLKQFKDMTTNIMKPFCIKGKEHQLTSIKIDLIELGFRVIGEIDSSTTCLYRFEKDILTSNRNESSQYRRDFNLPQDYQAALDYAKEYLTTIKPTEVKYTINASKNIEVVIKKDGVYEGSNRYPIGFIIDLKDLFDKPIKGIELYKLPPVPFNIDSVAIGCTSGITRQHIEDILKLYKQNFE